tara:strand:- start:369 stop:731 length:363 start_codon:yes stop_codon:yes gene_type:complete
MNGEVIKFKSNHTLQEREREAARVRQKYPNRIPVIVEKAKFCDNINDIDKSKYLVPTDLTVGQFIYVIRKRLKMNSEQGLFIFINEVMPPTTEQLSLIYDNYKDEDGFLYIMYSGENTFG